LLLTNYKIALTVLILLLFVITGNILDEQPALVVLILLLFVITGNILDEQPAIVVLILLVFVLQAIFLTSKTVLVVLILLVSMVDAMTWKSIKDFAERCIGMSRNHLFGDALGFIELMLTVVSFRMRKSLLVGLR